MLDRRNIVTLAAATAAMTCAAATAHGQSYQYQQRPSITYQPPQRTQPSQTYQSSQPTQTFQSSQPTQRYPSSQPSTSSTTYPSSSTSQPSSSHSSSTSSSQSRPTSAQPSPAGPIQVLPNYQPLDSKAIAQNSARCQNGDRSVQPDVSIGSCNAMIQETVKNLAAAFYYRANAHQAKKDFDKAIADYTQAISIDPTDADYLNGRAEAYEAKKDLSRAMADYDKAIQINPKSVYAYNNRGASFQRKGDFARASADYGEVTKLTPKNPDAWAARCWVRAAGGREVQQALSDCNEALKLKADAPDVLDTRGFVHLRLGKFDDAIKDYDAALKLDPKIAGALYGRGFAKMKKGDKSGAAADITAAKTIQQDIESEYSKLGLR